MAVTTAAAIACDACGASETVPIRTRLGPVEAGSVTCYADLDDESRAKLDVFLQAHVAPRALKIGERPKVDVRGVAPRFP